MLFRMGGCGRRHELEKRGSPIAPDLKTTPNHADLRSIEVRHLMTAQPVGEPDFPALIADESDLHSRFRP